MTFGDFEWDSEKAAGNERKHGVTFEEASTVFLDLDYLLAPDAADPERFVALGLSKRARILFRALRAGRESPNHQCAPRHSPRARSL